MQTEDVALVGYFAGYVLAINPQIANLLYLVGNQLDSMPGAGTECFIHITAVTIGKQITVGLQSQVEYARIGICAVVQKGQRVYRAFPFRIDPVLQHSLRHSGIGKCIRLDLYIHLRSSFCAVHLHNLVVGILRIGTNNVLFQTIALPVGRQFASAIGQLHIFKVFRIIGRCLSRPGVGDAAGDGNAPQQHQGCQ